MRATCSPQSELGPMLGARYDLCRRDPLRAPLWHVCGPTDIGHIDLTSAAPPHPRHRSPGVKARPSRKKTRPASQASPPQEPRGLRSLGHPRPRLTARTDDSHAAPLCRHTSHPRQRRRQRPRRLVRCPGYFRIKPHAPPFQQAPANLFRSPALRLLPRRGALRKRGGGPPAPIVDGMDYQSVKY